MKARRRPKRCIASAAGTVERASPTINSDNGRVASCGAGASRLPRIPPSRNMVIIPAAENACATASIRTASMRLRRCAATRTRRRARRRDRWRATRTRARRAARRAAAAVRAQRRSAGSATPAQQSNAERHADHVPRHVHQRDQAPARPEQSPECDPAAARTTAPASIVRSVSRRSRSGARTERQATSQHCRDRRHATARREAARRAGKHADPSSMRCTATPGSPRAVLRACAAARVHEPVDLGVIVVRVQAHAHRVELGAVVQHVTHEHASSAAIASTSAA